MKNYIFKSMLMLGTVAVAVSSCDLDEYDPNKVTGNEYLEQYEYYQGLVNKCYSPLINTFYQSSDYVALCEAGTDLWQAPQNGTNLEKYHYYKSMNADDSYVQKVWKFAYNTINTCNSVVQRAENVTDATPEQITQAIAQARCLRAFYYYVLVEQFGNVTLTLDDSTLGDVDFYPTRSTVAEIYAAIIADLKYAVQNLPPSWPEGEYSRVTKKSALGLLCRAYIQGAAYDLTDEETGKSYLEMAYDNDAWCAPVGMAWQRVRRERPECELYRSDNYHPAVPGSYLAANVIFTTLFRKPYRTEFTADLPTSLAEYLQQIAQQTVLDNFVLLNIR